MVGWSWQGVHLETGQGYDQDLGRRKFGTSFQEILMMLDHFRSLVCEYVWNSKLDFGVSNENQILCESIFWTSKVLRKSFEAWLLALVFFFGSCVLRSKCSSPTFMRVKSLEGFKTEKDSPKKLLYAPLILHGEAPSMAQDYLLLVVFTSLQIFARNFVFDIKPKFSHRT